MVDYVEKAEQVMLKLKKEKMVTTSQLRKFLTAVNTINGQVNLLKDKNGGQLAELPKDISTEVKYLKVKLAYQIGRAGRQDKKNPVWSFEHEAGIFELLDGIGKDVGKYDEFAKYVEALVAYHKFYGGRD